MLVNSELTHRPAVGKDIPFIYSTMLNSYRVDSTMGRTTRKSMFYEEYHKVLDALLSQDNVKVTVACLTTEPDVIIGYLIHEPNNIAHYAFVKDNFRQFGVLKSLGELVFDMSRTIYYSHQTRTFLPITFKQKNLEYNPFLLYKKEIHEKS